MDHYLNEQLRRLQTDHIDFYLTHGLTKARWENLRSLGVARFLKDAIGDGRIRYAGFSFHDELALFKEAEIEYKKRSKIPCTGCGCCLPCQANVRIPECFEMYNQACMFSAPDVAGANYKIFLGGILTGSPAFASQCRECGECEEKCPQGIPIRERLRDVAACFGK
jgi:predicted aldo/keto reductase-like oxidoreductase